MVFYSTDRGKHETISYLHISPHRAGANAGFMDYHHVGPLAEMRWRIRLIERNDVSVGIYIMQDLATFGGDNIPILPKFNLGGVAISFSRPIY